jgi:hypothetical protein
MPPETPPLLPQVAERVRSIVEGKTGGGMPPVKPQPPPPGVASLASPNVDGPAALAT